MIWKQFYGVHIIYVGPVWINSLFTDYSIEAYHGKCLCISYFYSQKDKIKLNSFRISYELFSKAISKNLRK